MFRINKHDPADEQIVLKAAARGDALVVEIALRLETVDSACEVEAFRIAAAEGHENIVRRIVELRPAVLAKDNGGALFRAADRFHIRITRYLLNCEYNRPGGVKFLEGIAEAADRDSSGNSVASRGLKSLLRIPRVCDDLRDADVAPIVKAAEDGRVTAALLLQRALGTATMAKTFKGLLSNPKVSLATLNGLVLEGVRYGERDLVELLLKHPGITPKTLYDSFRLAAAGDVTTEIMKNAIRYDHLEVLRIICEHPGPHEFRDDAVATFAARHGKLNALEIILDHPVKGRQAERALAVAVRYGQVHVVRALLKRPDVQLLDQGYAVLRRVGMRPQALTVLAALLGDPRVDPAASDIGYTMASAGCVDALALVLASYRSAQDRDELVSSLVMDTAPTRKVLKFLRSYRHKARAAHLVESLTILLRSPLQGLSGHALLALARAAVNQHLSTSDLMRLCDLGYFLKGLRRFFGDTPVLPVPDEVAQARWELAPLAAVSKTAPILRSGSACLSLREFPQILNALVPELSPLVTRRVWDGLRAQMRQGPHQKVSSAASDLLYEGLMKSAMNRVLDEVAKGIDDVLTVQALRETLYLFYAAIARADWGAFGQAQQRAKQDVLFYQEQVQRNLGKAAYATRAGVFNTLEVLLNLTPDGSRAFLLAHNRHCAANRGLRIAMGR